MQIPSAKHQRNGPRRVKTDGRYFKASRVGKQTQANISKSKKKKKKKKPLSCELCQVVSCVSPTLCAVSLDRGGVMSARLLQSQDLSSAKYFSFKCLDLEIVCAKPWHFGLWELLLIIYFPKCGKKHITLVERIEADTF